MYHMLVLYKNNKVHYVSAFQEYVNGTYEVELSSNLQDALLFVWHTAEKFVKRNPEYNLLRLRLY